MCIRPNKLECGTEVACRECWQCRKRRVTDLVGRCIAESEVSKKTYALTLTYDDQAGVNAVTLTYKDVMKFIHRLRTKYECRYICTGEYGSAKGRAHWHMIIFFSGNQMVYTQFQGPVRVKKREKGVWTGEYRSKKRAGYRLYIPQPLGPPDVEKYYKDYLDENGWTEKTKARHINKQRFGWPYWSDQPGHGFVYFQEPDWKGFEYCLKYVLKDQTQRQSDSHLAMSKYPPLGSKYFDALAEEHVLQGLVPQDYFYKFGNVRDSKNRDKSFMMTGKTKENFMSKFLEKWEQRYEKDPRSEIVDEYIDKITELSWTDEELMKRLHYKPVRYIEPWRETDDLGKWEDYIQHELEYEGIPIVMWEYEDKIHIITENDQWHEERKLVVEQIKKRSRVIQKRSLSQILREEWDAPKRPLDPMGL